MAKPKLNTVDESTKDSDARLRDIQNLLFGEQQSHLQGDIAKLKQTTQDSLNSIEQQFNAAIKQLRSDLQQDIEALGSRLESLNETRQTAEAGLEDSINSLQQSLSRHQDETENAHVALEKLLFSELDKLSQQTSEQQQAATTAAEAQLKSLQSSKVDSSDLAGLLTRLAAELDKR